MAGEQPNQGIPAGRAFLIGRETLASVREAAARKIPVMDPAQFEYRDVGKERYYRLRPVPGYREGRGNHPQPFEPDVKKVGEKWYMNLEKGWIVERVNGTAASYLFHAVDGTGEDAWHEVEPGESLWISYNTTKLGQITGAASVVASVGIPDGDGHYHPEAGGYGGETGKHIVRMTLFELVGDAPRLTWYGSGDHIHHYAERARVQNRYSPSGETGDRREWVHRYDPNDDTYWLRYLLQLAAGSPPSEYDPSSGLPVVKPLDPEADPADKTAVEIRMLAGRATCAQIRFRVSADGNILRAEGNDVWHNIVFQECAADGESDPSIKGVLAIRDGLVSVHADEASAPPIPEDKTLSRTEFTYANCHCCGEGI